MPTFTKPHPLTQAQRLAWFREARIGLFCHFGLYSLLGRGEWALNREGIPVAEYEKLADRFTIPRWSADAYTGLAQELGARYVVLTTKHHDGFCLFDSKRTDYTAVQRGPRRDLVGEVVESARRRNLKVGLYFSLNDWRHSPSGLDALEDNFGPRYRQYIDFVHGQVRELLTNYGKIDILWYDGWWPFDAKGWQAAKLLAMARKLQPHILTNDRSCLPGDFTTPEQHLGDSGKRMLEACFTLNDHWGFCPGDSNWKSPRQVIDMIVRSAQRRGNLLINIGPRGDGSIPPQSVRILREVGSWVHAHEQALRDGVTGKPKMDWTGYAALGFTARKGTIYFHVTAWPVDGKITLRGVRGKFDSAALVQGGKPLTLTQHGERVVITNLPRRPPNRWSSAIALAHRGSISSYQTGGLRPPKVAHCQYDPVTSLLPE